MFIRKKTVRGHTYYQVVRTVSVAGKTRQVLVVALGRSESIGKARLRAKLKTMALKQRLELLGDTAADRRERKRLDAWIARLERTLVTLDGILASGKIPVWSGANREPLPA